MQVPFIGSEAVAQGLIRKHQLRGRYMSIYPDVYTHRDAELTIRHRALAAWLWSRRAGVLAGLTAATLHGARYLDDNAPIELVSPNRRPPNGIRTHKISLRSTEITNRGALPVTSLVRTAFDLGRRDSLGEAVARLDALGQARRFEPEEVLELALNHPRARGIVQLKDALALHDPGAESPRETWLRLLLIRNGYPRPATQIPVISADGRRRYHLDMGWEDRKVAAEYDGEQHRLDPRQYDRDLRRSEDLDELGWKRVRVVSRHYEADVLHRVAKAWATSVHPARPDRPVRDLYAHSSRVS